MQQLHFIIIICICVSFTGLTMDDSPLQKVELQTDVYMVCLQHALSTENFEVMGLLIGNVS